MAYGSLRAVPLPRENIATASVANSMANLWLRKNTETFLVGMVGDNIMLTSLATR